PPPRVSRGQAWLLHAPQSRVKRLPRIGRTSFLYLRVGPAWLRRRSGRPIRFFAPLLRLWARARQGKPVTSPVTSQRRRAFLTNLASWLLPALQARFGYLPDRWPR